MGKENEMPGSSIKTIAIGWLKLLIGVLVILMFMFVIGPWIEKREFYRPVVIGIERFGINANAYYYTEVDQCSEAGHYIRAALDYPTKGNGGGK
jgi:hypothetical protein